MEIGDKLYPGAVRAQCDDAIAILEQNNLDIEKLQEQLQEFIVDEELTSQSYNALKLQINDYFTLTSAMMSANDLDISDMNILKNSVGWEDLLGEVIVTGRETAYEEMQEYEDLSADYASKSSAAVSMGEINAWYSHMASHYSMLAMFAKGRYEMWDGKAQKYDEINSLTQNLFTQSSSIRKAVATGLACVTKSFQNGAYVIDAKAPWRKLIKDENAKLFELAKSAYVKEDENGNRVYDWDKISELLNKEATEVSEQEYLVLAEMMSQMTNDELEILFARGVKHGVLGDMTCYGVRDVLKEASNRYLMLAQISAEMTLFNKHCEMVYDESAVTNNLSKAFFVNQVISSLESGIGRKCAVILSSEENGGKFMYTANVTYTLESRTDGGIVIPLVENQEIKVYPWGQSSQAEGILDNHVSASISTLSPSICATIGESVGTEIMGHIVDQMDHMDDKLAYSVSAIGLMMDIKEDYDTSRFIDGTIDAVATSQYVEAFDVKAGIVIRTGTGVNSAMLYSPKCSEESLMVGVEAYNEANQSGKIQIQDLKNAISGSKDGAETLEKYVDWYYMDAGKAKLKSYWTELDILLDEYRVKNSNEKIDSLFNLNSEQLQELIKKRNNSLHVINNEMMKGVQ